MKLIKPVKMPHDFPMKEDDLNPFSQSFLEASFDLLSGWLPYTAEELLAKYREKDPSFRFSLNVIDKRIYVLFSLPWLDENGQQVAGTVPERAPVTLLVGLVYDRNREVIADLALYHLAASDMHNEKIRSAFEAESDWLYWQSYIIDELCLMDHELKQDEEVLIYTNAYTGKDERQKGIFRNLMNLSESFFAKEKSGLTLYSVISLDPDVACYGKDRLDEPYIYSMKDEPVRLLNAEIIRKLGYTPLKLETDEEVEDGSLLWFAWKKTTWIDLNEEG